MLQVILKNCNVCQTCKKVLKYIWACLCPSTTEKLFYGQLYLLTLLCQMVPKGQNHLHKLAVERCRFI